MLKNTHQIPVINSEVNMHKNQIVDALQKYGFFFYPIKKGLEEIVQSTFNLSKTFFSLPLEDKISCGQAAGNDTGRVSGYYSTAEYEQDSSYSGDIKEAFQLLKNPFGELDDWPHNKWPIKIPEMESRLNMLYANLSDFASDIMKEIENEFELNNSELVQIHSQQKNFLRLLKYPAPNADQIANNRYWCGEHFDYGTLTLLFQTDSGGIQVKYGEQWLDVPNHEGYVLINSGSVLRALSGGRFKASHHRVPFPHNNKQNTFINDRYSIAFFVHPNYDAHIKNLSSDNEDFLFSSDFLRECMEISAKNNSGYKP